MSVCARPGKIRFILLGQLEVNWICRHCRTHGHTIMHHIHWHSVMAKKFDCMPRTRQWTNRMEKAPPWSPLHHRYIERASAFNCTADPTAACMHISILDVKQIQIRTDSDRIIRTASRAVISTKWEASCRLPIDPKWNPKVKSVPEPVCLGMPWVCHTCASIIIGQWKRF